MNKELLGETLHRVLYAYWGEHPMFGPDGDYSGLGDGAMAGWDYVARKVLEVQAPAAVREAVGDG